MGTKIDSLRLSPHDHIKQTLEMVIAENTRSGHARNIFIFRKCFVLNMRGIPKKPTVMNSDILRGMNFRERAKHTRGIYIIGFVTQENIILNSNTTKFYISTT